eukprot:SM000144S00662  [mRNA]  locus=s144:6259:15298:- [translate_table: standard]
MAAQERAYAALLDRVLCGASAPAASSGGALRDRLRGRAHHLASRDSGVTATMARVDKVRCAARPAARHGPPPTRSHLRFSSSGPPLVPGSMPLPSQASLIDPSSSADEPRIPACLQHLREGKMRLRDDCPLIFDVALRRKALAALMAYEPFWLRLGLDAVLGTEATALRREDWELEALTKRLLFGAQPAAQSSASRPVHCNYELSNLLLRKFLLLILILDKAKVWSMEANTELPLACQLENAPLLFRATSKIKSSKEALEECLKDCMFGEGDIIRHLGFLGYRVTYVQARAQGSCSAPLLEYDFRVINVAVDLRDGVRICRVIQVLGHDTSLLTKIQVPATSRVVRLHNCDLALRDLASRGVLVVDGQGKVVVAADIADGRREQSLAVLWAIVLHWRVTLDEVAPGLLLDVIHQSCHPIPGVSSQISAFRGLSDETQLHLPRWTQAALCIQRAWRSMLWRRSLRRSIAAAMKIQRMFRSHLQRAAFLQVLIKHRAATAVQAAWRGSLARATVQRWQKAALTIGHAYRSYKERKRKELEGQAAVTLQAAVRGWLCWHRFKTGLHSIVLIQSNWRRLQAQKSFLTSRSAALQIQRAFRRYRLWVFLRERLVQARAATTIQATWRGYQTRACVRLWHRSASTIGGVFRAHLLHRRRQAMRQAATILLQRLVKGWLCRRQYEATRYSARVIQRAWRRVRQRDCEKRRMAAATKIQRKYRAYQERAAYISMLAQSRAAVIVQAAWRGYRSRSVQKQRHQAARLIQTVFKAFMEQQQAQKLRRQAALMLQRNVRSWLCRRAFKDRMQRAQASRVIQRHWRTIQGRRALLRAVGAAISIQRAYREYRRRTALKLLVVRTRAATRLQAAWRGHLARTILLRWHEAAAVIQREFLVHKAWSQLQQQMQSVKAAKRIQRAWRLNLRRRACLRILAAVMSIQRAYRGYRTRVAFKSMVAQTRASLRLQAAWRGHTARAAVKSWHRSAATIQAFFRAHVAWKQHQQQLRELAATRIQQAWRRAQKRWAYVRMTRGVIYIQRVFRGHRSRCACKLIAERTRAARKIQAVWTGYTARAAVRSWHLSAAIIQRYFRLHLAWKQQRQQLRELEAAKQIQQAWRRAQRRWATMRTVNCVINIQRIYRANRDRNAFKLTVTRSNAAARLQAAWRGRIVRATVRRWHESAAVFQRSYRSHKAWKQRRHRAAVELQRVFRGWMCRRRIKAAICIQRAWRQKLQLSAWRRCSAAAVHIQRIFRGYQARADCCILLQRHQAATRLQAAWRAYVARAALRSWHRAVSVIERAFKLHKARQDRQKTEREAAIILQQVTRGWLCRRRFNLAMQRILFLQQAWRSARRRRLFLLCAKAVVHLMRRKGKAAVTIQAAWRGHEARLVMQKWHSSAFAIQSAFRDYLVRKEGKMHQRRAAVTIQRAVRLWIQQRDQKLRQQEAEAAKCIQRAWRNARELRSLMQSSKAALDIQRAYRAYRQRANVKVSLLQANASIVIQASWRAFQGRAALQRRVQAACLVGRAFKAHVARKERRLEAAVKLQRVVRGWICRRHYSVMKQKAILIQAHWRAYKERRKEGARQSKLRALRRRITQAASRAEARSCLGHRAKDALAVLLASKTVSQVLRSCAAIDMATEHSRGCCELIAKGGAIRSLLHFIQSCNRSTPHVQLLKHALSILCNVCRYHELVDDVFTAPDCVNILVEQLQMYRDREEIFGRALQVLRAICAEPLRLSLVCEMRDTAGRLRSLAHILTKKLQVESRLPTRLPSAVDSARDTPQRLDTGAAQLRYLKSLLSAMSALAQGAAPLIHVRQPGSAVAALPLLTSPWRTPGKAGHIGAMLSNHKAQRLPFRDLSNARSSANTAFN